jgi:hypothetical protein
MVARFEFNYESDLGANINVDVTNDIFDKDDKTAFIHAVADILGLEIAIRASFEEEVFDED